MPYREDFGALGADSRRHGASSLGSGRRKTGDLESEHTLRLLTLRLLTLLTLRLLTLRLLTLRQYSNFRSQLYKS
jgi:hypothetical protein